MAEGFISRTIDWAKSLYMGYRNSKALSDDLTNSQLSNNDVHKLNWEVNNLSQSMLSAQQGIGNSTSLELFNTKYEFISGSDPHHLSDSETKYKNFVVKIHETAECIKNEEIKLKYILNQIENYNKKTKEILNQISTKLNLHSQRLVGDYNAACSRLYQTCCKLVSELQSYNESPSSTQQEKCKIAYIKYDNTKEIYINAERNLEENLSINQSIIDKSLFTVIKNSLKAQTNLILDYNNIIQQNKQNLHLKHLDDSELNILRYLETSSDVFYRSIRQEDDVEDDFLDESLLSFQDEVESQLPEEDRYKLNMLINDLSNSFFLGDEKHCYLRTIRVYLTPKFQFTLRKNLNSLPEIVKDHKLPNTSLIARLTNLETKNSPDLYEEVKQYLIGINENNNLELKEKIKIKAQIIALYTYFILQKNRRNPYTVSADEVKHFY